MMVAVFVDVQQLCKPGQNEISFILQQIVLFEMSGSINLGQFWLGCSVCVVEQVDTALLLPTTSELMEMYIMPPATLTPHYTCVDNGRQLHHGPSIFAGRSFPADIIGQRGQK